MTAQLDRPQRASTMVEGVREALDEAMALDESVIMLGEDIGDEAGGGVYKYSKGLSTKYGARVRSTPIAEEVIVGAAVGAALAGMRPVAEIMLSNFLHGAMDQICNHAAKLRYMSGGQTGVPLTICTSGTGPGAAAQHSEVLEAWFCHSPGMKVVIPSTPGDAKGLLLSCIFDDDPCLFVTNSRLPRGVISGVPGERIPLGKAAIRRAGSDVTVVTYGNAAPRVEAVAAALGETGVSVEVVDLRTVQPWDTETVFDSVRKTGRAVVVHTAVRSFGVGAEISARIAEELFAELRAPVQRVGAKSIPIPYSPGLAAASVFADQDIEAAIRKALAT